MDADVTVDTSAVDFREKEAGTGIRAWSKTIIHSCSTAIQHCNPIQSIDSAIVVHRGHFYCIKILLLPFVSWNPVWTVSLLRCSCFCSGQVDRESSLYKNILYIFGSVASIPILNRAQARTWSFFLLIPSFWTFFEPLCLRGAEMWVYFIWRWAWDTQRSR